MAISGVDYKYYHHLLCLVALSRGKTFYVSTIDRLSGKAVALVKRNLKTLLGQMIESNFPIEVVLCVNLSHIDHALIPNTIGCLQSNRTGQARLCLIRAEKPKKLFIAGDGLAWRRVMSLLQCDWSESSY